MNKIFQKLVIFTIFVSILTSFFSAAYAEERLSHAEANKIFWEGAAIFNEGEYEKGMDIWFKAVEAGHIDAILHFSRHYYRIDWWDRDRAIALLLWGVELELSGQGYRAYIDRSEINELYLWLGFILRDGDANDKAKAITFFKCRPDYESNRKYLAELGVNNWDGKPPSDAEWKAAIASFPKWIPAWEVGDTSPPIGQTPPATAQAPPAAAQPPATGSTGASTSQGRTLTQAEIQRFNENPSELVDLLADADVDLGEAIKNGLNINARNSVGSTALMLAADQNINMWVVRHLLEAGADVNARNNNGSTALMAAANQYIVEDLLEAGADINARNNNGSTALLLAVYRRNINVVIPLLQAGANANVRNNDGYTALMYAASQGDVQAVRFLLGYGADVNARDNLGASVGYHALRSRNYSDVILILRNAGLRE